MITKKLMERLFPTKGLNPGKYNLVRYRDELIDALNYFLPRYAITGYFRIVAFLACCGIETDYFKTSKEYASGADYEGRRDLGNVIKGDGRRFPGKSIIQTTGRYNYWRVTVRFVKKRTGKDFSKDLVHYEKKGLRPDEVFEKYLASPHYAALLAEADRLDVNFLARPEKLAEIRYAVEAACIFWEENNLNKYADAKEFQKLNGVVNRGNPNKMPLHWAKRNELYSKCLRYLPKDIEFAPAQLPVVTTVMGDSSYTTQAASVENSPEDLTNPVAVPPAEPATTEPAKDDSFLASAVDRNVSADEMRNTARTALPRVLGRFARPVAILWAMLEAGNIYAWLGVAVGVIGLALLIYWHRNDLKKVLDKIKTKILQ